MCGGFSTGRSCVHWSAEQGTWVTLPLTLTEEREYSSVWTVSRDSSLVILGSVYAGETSETVSSEGVSTRPYFKMKYQTWWDLLNKHIRKLNINIIKPI